MAKQTGKFLGATPTTSRENNGNTYYERRIYLDITGDSQYQNKAEFLVKGADKCASIDNLKVGDKVEADYEIRGREYDKKDGSGRAFFQNLEAWKVSKISVQPASMIPGSQVAAPVATPAVAPAAAGGFPLANSNGITDDLPF